MGSLQGCVGGQGVATEAEACKGQAGDNENSISMLQDFQSLK